MEEFTSSWKFILLMLGLLCFFVLLIPIGILLAILFVRRADRDKQDVGN